MRPIPIAYVGQIRNTACDNITEPLDSYIALRKSLGFKYSSQASFLRSFAGFLKSRGVTSYDQVDNSTANMWTMSRRAEVAPHTFNSEISTLGSFFNYLVDCEMAVSNPFESVSPVRVPGYVPFVFTVEQMFFLFDAIHRGHKNPHPVREQAYYHIYHTIYALGLRASELCNLTLKDVDLERDTVLIRQTKFFKDRLLPINLRTHDLLSEYLDIRKKRASHAGKESQWFFINRAGGKMSRCSLTITFQRYVSRAGISSEKRLHPNVVFGAPHLHSLRHTFAVHRLLKWYRDGTEDINSKLPQLATYMGHTHFSYTQVYLTITEEIFKLASKKYEKKYDTFDINPQGRHKP